MDIKIESSWKQVLAAEFDKPYFEALTTFVRSAYLTSTVYPPPQYLFKAFDDCPFTSVKVVILGQDPYHGSGQAHGLAFSVNQHVAIPPSLLNIYKELHSDLGTPIPKDGNLERWSQQGVLLLNSTLTVAASQAGSHQKKGWEQFTDAVIKILANDHDHLVFMLWGNYAKKKGALIDRTKHLVLEAAHPSPLGAYKGFFGCKHFSQADEYLCKHSIQEIKW